MTMPASWMRHAETLAEREQANESYRKVRRAAGACRRSASVVAWLALPWEGLCMPMGSDPHVTCDEECGHGAPLGEVVPFMWGVRPLTAGGANA